MASNYPPDAENHPRAPYNDYTEQCDQCNDGLINASDCCGANIIYSDICSECLGECNKAECEVCSGLGYI